MKKIDANYSKLAEDARNSTKLNFYDAIKVIDNEFGEGYAEKIPY